MPDADLAVQPSRVRLESDTLYDVIRTIASSPDLDRVLEGVVDVLTKATQCHACFVYLRREQRLRLRAASRVYARLVGRVEFADDEGLAAWVVQGNQPAFIRENALEDPRTVFVPELEEERFQSMVAVPIPSRADGVMGAILLHTIAPREFDERTLTLLAHAAPLVAGAIENAQLYADAHARVAALTALSALSQRIAAGRGPRRALPRAATEGVRALLACEAVELHERDPERERLQLVAADPPRGAADAGHGNAERGAELRVPVAAGDVCVVRAPDGDGGAPLRAERAESALRRIAPGALCEAGGERVRALLPLAAGGSVGELAALDAALAQLGLADGLAIGRSEVHRGAAEGRGGLREAADAAFVAGALRRRGGTLAYRELGAYRYLVPLAGEDAPPDPFLDAVRALDAYDRRRGSRLVATLEQYLADRGRVTETARALTVHPNTLRQRLERIETLTGLDLASADLLVLELAVKLARLRPGS